MPISIDPVEKNKVLAGRIAVDAYREAHRQLHAGGWYKSISEDHTPLLKKLVADLEKIGITSAELDFEPKKTEVLAKMWADSDLLNLKELGFIDKTDFKNRATKLDREIFEGKWH